MTGSAARPVKESERLRRLRLFDFRGYPAACHSLPVSLTWPHTDTATSLLNMPSTRPYAGQTPPTWPTCC